MAQGKIDDVQQRLFAEVLGNIKVDRERLVGFVDGLVRTPDSAVFGETIVKATDALSKMTAQLIELMKLKAKDAPRRRDGSPLTDEDVDGLYGEIDKRSDDGTN